MIPEMMAAAVAQRQSAPVLFARGGSGDSSAQSASRLSASANDPDLVGGEGGLRAHKRVLQVLCWKT